MVRLAPAGKTRTQAISPQPTSPRQQFRFVVDHQVFDYRLGRIGVVGLGIRGFGHMRLEPSEVVAHRQAGLVGKSPVLRNTTRGDRPETAPNDDASKTQLPPPHIGKHRQAGRGILGIIRKYCLIVPRIWWLLASPRFFVHLDRFAIRGFSATRWGVHYSVAVVGLAKKMPFIMGFRLVESAWKWGLDAGVVKYKKSRGFGGRKW